MSVVHSVTTVYVLTMTAVYDQGCAGVFVSKEDAVDHARAMWEDSDGHHRFRINEVRVDAPVWLSGRKIRPDATPRGAMVPIEFIPWEDDR